MIAQMKKVSIVVLDKDKQSSLKSLKKLGIMHLSENFGSSDDVKALEERIKEIETSLRLTEGSDIQHVEAFDIVKISEIVDTTCNIGKDIYNLEERESILNRNLEFLEPWGDFNPSDLVLLKEKGVDVTLVDITKEQWHHLDSNLNVFKIAHNNLGFLAAVIGECPKEFARFDPPELGLEDALGAVELLKEELKEKYSELKKLSIHHGNILLYKKSIEDSLEFEKIRSGMGYDEDFAALQGWIPVEKIDKFVKTANSEKWGYALSEPVDGDDTPTLLKGNKITSMIHPLLDFLGNVPGYWETDVSPFFLIFFTIFFAMIIGDAGYGLLFILLTFVAQIKMNKFNNVLALFYLISSATVVWGAMTGSWFGSNMIKGIPFFNGFILSQLDTDKEIMELCFHIAVVHIVLARLTAFVKSMKDKLLSGFANLGWLSMTVGLLFLVKNLVISSTDYPVPTYSLIIVAFGFIVVLIFGKQEKGQSFLKGVGMSLAFSPLTALDTVGAFGDIISYVRLYAVGLAGFAVAQSFNGMAAPLISSGGFGYFGGALILLGGHVFNIAMAALSVLVHGVRLNVLEFSSAADVNWTGKKFNPFREI